MGQEKLKPVHPGEILLEAALQHRRREDGQPPDKHRHQAYRHGDQPAPQGHPVQSGHAGKQVFHFDEGSGFCHDSIDTSGAGTEPVLAVDYNKSHSR